MNILVSACLLGVNCRYNGVPAPSPAVLALMERHTLIPVCPEQLGGLPTPREPSEHRAGRVVTKSGRDVTEEYGRGAQEALRLAQIFGCRYAILKERSPSCGHGRIYDGSFSGVLIPGSGAAAALLEQNGVTVLGESELELLPE
jgi:uncharacterized protein YbbK (DUF523 family)